MNGMFLSTSQSLKHVIFLSLHGGDYEEYLFWDMTPCGPYKNQRFGGTYRLQHQAEKN
jgi:hypothetical protein